MQLEVKDKSGQVVKKIDVPDSIFAVPMNEHVLHLVVKAYQANRRQGTHATKTRAYVSGGGKKPFKQKGTGNARQGTSRAPHMPGGAVVHGPRPRDYSQKINKKMRQLALRVALSDKLRHNNLIVINDFDLSQYSTKQVAGLLKNLGVHQGVLADERKDDLLYKSARNIQNVWAVRPAELNAEDLLRGQKLVVSENAVTSLVQRLGA